LNSYGECASLGAAVCAGMALGLFSDKAALTAFLGNTSRQFIPNPTNVGIYEEGYRKFQFEVSVIKQRS